LVPIFSYLEDRTQSKTHQKCGHGVGGAVPRPLPHRRDLLLGELAGLEVGAQHGGEEAWLVIQLGGEGPLLVVSQC